MFSLRPAVVLQHSGSRSLLHKLIYLRCYKGSIFVLFRSAAFQRIVRLAVRIVPTLGIVQQRLSNRCAGSATTATTTTTTAAAAGSSSSSSYDRFGCVDDEIVGRIGQARYTASGPRHEAVLVRIQLATARARLHVLLQLLLPHQVGRVEMASGQLDVRMLSLALDDMHRERFALDQMRHLERALF